MTKPLHKILIQPVLTEKSVRSTSLKRFTSVEARKVAGGNEATKKALLEQKVVKYTFMVALDATKPEIAQAIELMFAKEKVKVANVHTLHVRGKRRKVVTARGKRPSVGTMPNWKKAIVTLAPDSPTIPLLEGA
jgi:large subunit ribosomal protein L23